MLAPRSRRQKRPNAANENGRLVRVVAIRTRKAKMSQSVFAKLLNVSVSTVQKWEAPAADKHPSGAAAKLLQIIEQKGVRAIV